MKKTRMNKRKMPNSPYAGSGWGKYLRVTTEILDLLESTRGKLVALRSIAEVDLGYTTGYNPFFYLTPKIARERQIERRFLKPILKSPKNIKGLIVAPTDSKKLLFLVDKNKGLIRGTHAYNYIMSGQRDGIPKRDFFKNKVDNWYKVKKMQPPYILQQNLFWETHRVFFNEPKLSIDKKLIGISPHKSEIAKPLCAYLNSTLATFFREFTGRTPLGEGALDISTNDLRKFPVPNLKTMGTSTLSKLEDSFTKLAKRTIGSLSEELGADSAKNFDISKVREDRKELDKIVFKILDLSKEGQLKVYVSAIELLRLRKERAVSTGRTGKRNGPEIAKVAELVMREVDTSKIGDFPDEYTNELEYKTVALPAGSTVIIGQDLIEGPFIEIDGQKIPCETDIDAKYLRYSWLNKHFDVRFVDDEEIREVMVEKYDKIISNVSKAIRNAAAEQVPDLKLRKKVEDYAIKHIFAREIVVVSEELSS